MTRSVAIVALLAWTLGCGGTAQRAGEADPCAVPASALTAEDVSHPTTVIGTGTPASCTGAAVVAAVAAGGVITFDCGPDPVSITLTQTAKVVNRDREKIVIDGGNRVTLSGGGTTRILYMNTCDQAQNWLTPRCDDQQWPQLTVQNVTFQDGNATGLTPEGGGGAIFSSGGRLRIVNARFLGNRGDATGPDVGGAAVRAFQQWQGLPIYVVDSTFGGAGALANVSSNGAGLSSIGVSWTVVNSTFVGNAAVGNGANPARPTTPGGGSGGGIYMDGNTMTLALCGVHMTGNTANEGGGAVFFVSNDSTGRVKIADSVLTGNTSGRFQTQPGMFIQGAGTPTIVNSTIH
jgi:hypothetical protein